MQKLCEEIYETYRLCWGEAYEKEKKQSRWNYTLFLLGGGSKIQSVVDALGKTVWRGCLPAPPIGDAGIPTDLYDWPSTNRERSPFVEEATFVLVAYGLSRLGTEVPEVDNPDEMPPLEDLQRVRPPIDQDEYYPK